MKYAVPISKLQWNEFGRGWRKKRFKWKAEIRRRQNYRYVMHAAGHFSSWYLARSDDAVKVPFSFSRIAMAARFSEAEPRENRHIVRHLDSRAREERSLSARSCRNRKFRLATGGASFRFDALARVERPPRGSVSENVFVRARRFSPSRSMFVRANKRNRVLRFLFLLSAELSQPLTGRCVICGRNICF